MLKILISEFHKNRNSENYEKIMKYFNPRIATVVREKNISLDDIHIDIDLYKLISKLNADNFEVGRQIEMYIMKSIVRGIGKRYKRVLEERSLYCYEYDDEIIKEAYDYNDYYGVHEYDFFKSVCIGGGLSLKESTILYYAFYEDMPVTLISYKINCSSRSICNAKTRALKKLRKYLEVESISYGF